MVANDSVKRKVIKSVVRKQKVDLFCIQETKIQVLSDRVVRSLGPGRFLDWKALDTFGSAGGIFDLLGQKISRTAGMGGGPVFYILQIQECGKWGCLGVHGCLWSVYQRRKGVFVGRNWGD